MSEDSPKKPQGKPGKTRKIPKRVNESWLRNSSLYYLERHPASIAHYVQVMDRKMQRSLRVHTDQDLMPFQAYLREKLVPEFVRAGYLNDALFAGALKDSLTRKGLPKAEIKRRLKSKGLAAETIDDIPMDDHDDLTAALVFIDRKRLRKKDPQKALAAMARNGFSYDVASRALKMDEDEIKERLNA